MANKPMKTINFGGEDTYYLAPDFKNIENAPFGEETTYGDTLTWDGNTEGLEVCPYIPEYNLNLYRISNKVVNLDELTNGVVVTVSGLEPYAINSIVEISDGILANAEDQTVFFVTKDNIEFGAGTMNKGIYTPVNGIAVSLTINGYNGFETTTVKPIDNKYLEPFETVGGDTLTWDGNTDGLESVDLGGALAIRISDAVLTESDLANGTAIEVKGTDSDGDSMQMTGTASLITDSGLTCVMVNSAVAVLIVVPNDGFELDGVVFDKKGLYTFPMSVVLESLSLTINGYTGFTATKLKKEYIPVDYIKQLIAEVTGK